MAPSGSAPLLVASNRGPLSFVERDDGTLRAQPRRWRAGLGAVRAGQRRRRVGLRRALRRRPGGRPAGRRTAGSTATATTPAAWRSGCSTSTRPPSTGPTTRSRTRTLWFVHHLLYATPTAPAFDAGFRREWASYAAYNQAFADALSAEAAEGAKVLVQDYHLTLAPAAAARPAARPAHRALLAHAVGAGRLLPGAARRRRPRDPARHARRRPRRVPLGALGPGLRGLLRRRCSARRPTTAAGDVRRPHHPARRAPARRRRRGAARARARRRRRDPADGAARASSATARRSCGSTAPS